VGVEDSRISQRRRAAQVDGNSEYAAKRNELIRLAATVFREKGYESATLNDVAKRFGTDRASLYYYVGSKEELFHECVKGILDDNLAAGERILAMKDSSPRQKLQLLLETVLVSYEANYPYMYVYIQEDMAQLNQATTSWASEMTRQTRRLEKLFLTVIDEGKTLGIFRDDVPTSLAANALFGMLNWTHRWYKPGRKQSAHEVAEAFSKIFFEGLEDGTGATDGSRQSDPESGAKRPTKVR
jgi:AcrR family transcriptional regulator